MPRTVTEALARVMHDLPAIGKDGRADASQGGYAYRGIEQITREAQRLFAKYGVVWSPRVTSHVIKDITVRDKPWTDTILTVAYDVYGPSHTLEEPDTITVGPLVAIGRDNSDKGANKCMTQAFKYALLQVLCISDGADDNDGTHDERDAPAHVDPKERAEADEAMRALGAIIRDIADTDERAKLQERLREKYGDPQHMTLAQIVEAQTFAAGWPDTDAPVTREDVGASDAATLEALEQQGAMPQNVVDALAVVPEDIRARAKAAAAVMNARLCTEALAQRDVTMGGTLKAKREMVAALMAIEEYRDGMQQALPVDEA